MLAEAHVAERFGDDAVEQGIFGMLAAGLDTQRSGDGGEVAGELGLVDVDADAGYQGGVGGLNHDAGEFAVVQHHVVGPAQVGGNACSLVHGALHREAEGHGHGRTRGGQAEDHRHVETAIRAGVPGMTVATDTCRLGLGHHDGAVRFTQSCQRCRVLHRGRRGVEPDDHSSSSRKLRSTARAECVIAPQETKSAPVSA